jgi:UMF1 family MFS transporter
MLRTLSWALFDLANTFFAVAMLSFYFPLWVVEDQGAKELSFSLALGGSMACVAVLMPFCGALSDVTGQHMRWLRWTTYGCTAATALIGMTSSLGVALVLFAIANGCYQLGTVFYDALLWRLAPRGRLGQVSGIGAAFGYAGSMLGLGLLHPFVVGGGHRAAFVPSAVYFLLFAVPSFVLIRESRTTRMVAWREVARVAALRLAITIRSARRFAGLWRYLWASFFSLSAINTVLVFMAVYTRKVVGLSEGELIRFFVFSQAFAIAGSVSFTVVIRRWGAKRTLMGIWCGWIGALTLLALTPAGRWLWVVGPIIGFCLGSTWATARVLVTELSPKEQLAEMFGLAGLFGRFSAIVGPLCWGLVVWDPSRYTHAVLMLIGLLAIGIWMLRGVKDVDPQAVQ